MSTEQQEAPVVEQPSYLEMSDEDIMKQAAPVLPPVTAEAKVEETKEVEAPAADEDDSAAGGDAEDVKDAKVEGEEDEAAGDSKAAKSDEAEDLEAKKADEKKVEKPAADDEAKKEPKTDEVVIDYKAEYERLLAPFKANGKEVKVENAEEAIALMQMGANYTKKMAALKPNLKLMKMLENSGFLSEDKIGFLIDLGKKDPAAINKLVKDSGIDPMDLDAEKAGAYKPKTYAVGDAEIELDTVLDELSGSETYTRTLDVVSNKWDAASKQTIAAHPHLLKVIDSHVANGIYDLISNAIEKERMLGRLTGLSDIDAYKQVGDAIQASGGFNHLAPTKAAPKSNTPPAVVAPKPKAQEDDKLKEKRRAASSTKPAAPAVIAQDFNPLEMSDEEFSKLPMPKFR